MIGILLAYIIINTIYFRSGRRYRPPPCSGNLRNLGIIITNYSTDHQGHYPQNLDVLKTLGYIEILPVCSETGNQYILQVDGWDSPDFTVFCPNPEEHTHYETGKILKSFYYASRKGVIEVVE